MKNRKENISAEQFAPHIQKTLEVFGQKKGWEMLAGEYQATANTELEITKLRWTIYTAFTGISLALSGYLWSSSYQNDPVLIKSGLIGGAFIHLIAFYFYQWLHRTALNYRRYLKELEKELGFKRYSIRLDRPSIGPISLRFYWGIFSLLLAHILGVVFYILFA
ncbi:MAG: hypothetical protein PVG14_05555 [Anaerolineales bacterium]|jgi:hypothetical protein